MAKFQIGDRVRYFSRTDGLPYGSIGTVVYVSSSDNTLEGDWDDFILGHTSGGKSRNGHGWSVPSAYCELLPTEPDSPIPEELSILYAITEPSSERPKGAAQKRKTTATRL